MDGVFKLSNELISDHIREEVPGLRSHQVVNQLLNGDWHMQTVGEGAPDLTLVIYCNLEGVGTLNEMQSLGTPVKVVSRGITRTGLVEGRINWAEEAPGYFRGDMMVMVTEGL